MPIPNVTPYPGEMPSLSDPVTFDARMTSFAAWFEAVMAETAAMVDAMNLALNDNGTVLDATAEATRRATNATVPALTTGTESAYVVAASVTVPALVAGEPVAVRTHVANPTAATLNVDGLGAAAIRKIDATGALVPLEGGEFAAFDEHVFVYNGTYWVLQTQPLRELVAGPGIVPLAAQTGDFDDLVEGGRYDIDGDWSNGPLGAAATDYGALAFVDRRRATDGAYVVQEVAYLANGSLLRSSRVGTGSSITWSSWVPMGSPFRGPDIAAGEVAVWSRDDVISATGDDASNVVALNWTFVQSGTVKIAMEMSRNDSDAPRLEIYKNGVYQEQIVVGGGGYNDYERTFNVTPGDNITLRFDQHGSVTDVTSLRNLEIRTDGTPVWPSLNGNHALGEFTSAAFA